MKFSLLRYAVAAAFVLAIEMTGMTQTGGLVGRYTAVTANLSSPGEGVRFDFLRWSTDMERDQAVSAMETGGDNALNGLLQKAPTIGYVWTSESAGYSMKYAYRVPLADGGERIVMAIDRELGMYEPQRWKLSGTEKTQVNPFTVIELRISKAGMGEGKASLTAKVVVDKQAKTIALENYSAVPVLFQGVKK